MKILKILTRWILGIFSFLVLYSVLALVLPLIPVRAVPTDEPRTVTIYILSNGVHTDLVVPVKNEIYDWASEIPFSNTRSQETDYLFLAVGWGDKEFYLDTPNWSDLKAGVAFRAVVGWNTTALHCTYYHGLIEGKDCKKILITSNQYRKLVDFMNKRFKRDSGGKVVFIPTNAVYGNNDAFYEATGTYNLFYTCNTWTNSGLKAAGQKAALWTITDFGIFRHY